ncbi:protein translocase subunit SecF [Amorphoplanes digitatis]|uniref:Protein-export membrane protein SecF n=1 Tax=Actinoplanes digitatis TaxID=1868 RepID=A0A7W7HUV0_9ACTN|nr:protein translocase subunit SecF [Actinoplanes digitatis]MBB4761202.1 preprotein translocase subunit SecF [Actinoplanes digitatis]GID92819.1 protein-export membrane protein SecF [Actinoplanes digitatis]
MASKGLAERLYLGEANLNIVGRRKMWFGIFAGLLIVALGSFVLRGFDLGIEFAGGTQFAIPASTGTQAEAQSAMARAVETAGVAEEANVGPVQQVGKGADAVYTIRTAALSQEKSTEIKNSVAADLKVSPDDISDDRVSAAWGTQVTQQALLGLGIFLVLVLGYLVVRFEWRMAVAAVMSLLIDLVLTAGVYSLVGFEVTPSTVIGFLTILGFSLYDVVVVFDKVQENTRGITGGTAQTYAEATNLAVNQTLMRSINTGLVALLPVGGLLFIGAGLLGAGSLKDLGLVLFVGMGLGVISSILFAAPMLVALKNQEPRIKSHNARVLARRSAARSGDVARGERPRSGKSDAEEAPALAGSTPRPGARPAAKRGGTRGGAGNRPSGGQKRR